ncbi:MAG: MarR family transcriptional regulator [Chloroflexi bacterium]|nr:MarR family transcriptional regulator [Chloroflexota bacterium]
MYHLGALPQKTIGKKLLISKCYVVSVVDELEDRGLAVRQRDIHDRR